MRVSAGLKTFLPALLIIFLLSGCGIFGWIGEKADALGKKMPTYGERCEEDFCFGNKKKPPPPQGANMRRPQGYAPPNNPQPGANYGMGTNPYPAPQYAPPQPPPGYPPMPQSNNGYGSPPPYPPMPQGAAPPQMGYGQVAPIPPPPPYGSPPPAPGSAPQAGKMEAWEDPNPPWLEEMRRKNPGAKPLPF